MRVEGILEDALADLPEDVTLSSRLICDRLGRRLEKSGAERAMLKSAFQRGVPVFVPAFTDSELGLDVAIYNKLRVRAGRRALPFDLYLDLEDFTERIRRHETLGIFTIGGGVPRN